MLYVKIWNAAIAEMCAEFGCKLIALKGVTDLVQHHDETHFWRI